ncbi:MAG: phage minor head protein [Gammaproteobacteria bacterium]
MLAINLTETDPVGLMIARMLSDLREQALDTLLPVTGNTKRLRPIYNRLEQVLFEELQKQAQQIPYSQILIFYQRELLLTEAAIDLEINVAAVVGESLEGGVENFAAALEPALAAAMAEGMRATIADLVAELGLDAAEAAAFSAPLEQMTIKWAKEHAGELVRGINSTTQKEIADSVARALAEQKGVPGLTRDLQAKLGDLLGRKRAELIATTEMNIAVSTGAFRAAKEVGASEKEWITQGDNRVSQSICQPNEGDGMISIDAEFQSGHSFTPGHPRCRCGVAYHGANPKLLGA